MKNLRLKGILIGAGLLALSGCSSEDYPHVFGANEVPPEVASEPRVVMTPTPEMGRNASFQRLADVPQRPRDFTSNKLVQQTLSEMHTDQSDAANLRVTTDMPASVDPSESKTSSTTSTEPGSKVPPTPPSISN